MGAKVKKSTRKFLAKTKANGGKPVHHGKKGQGPAWKRQARAGEKAAAAAASGDAELDEKKVEELDVDEFLAGDFLGGYGQSDSEDGGDSGSDDDEAELGSLDGDDADAGVAPLAAGGASSSDEDDEDGGDEEGAAGAAGVRAQNRRLGDEVASHRAQLERLQEADPEFFAYLQATDKELLAFGQGEGASSGDEEDEEDEGGSDGEDAAEEEQQSEEKEEAPAQAKAAAPAAGASITLAQVDAWTAAALDKASFGAVRSLLRAYRSACHYGDSEEEVEAGMRIASSAVYNRLMLFVLKHADGILRRMLGEGEGGRALEASALAKLPRWRKVEPLVKSYMGNTLHLLGQMTESTMLAFILRRVRASALFLAPYDKLQRRYLKAALGLFGSGEAAPRVQAVLLVRQMALALPPPAMDACLKGIYRAYAANAKFVNASSAAHVGFMASCVVEMYGLDPAAAYRHAFGFVRQLAVLLRQALTSKTKDAFREVYCWRTVNCLELWAKVLAAHADSPDMRPLVYPVAQLLLGAARLVPTPGYFPLRLRLARALNKLAQASGAYIPVAPLLLEILQWGDLSRAPRPAPGDRAPELLLQLRAGKSAMRSAAYQEEVIETTLELLAEHLSQWACHVAFPELAHLPLAQLRRFAKTTPVERFRRSSRQLVDATERNVAFVGRARDQVDFAPKDLAQAAAFLAAEAAASKAPLQQHAATLRDRARARLALRMAQSVELGGAGDEYPGDGGSSDEEEEPEGDLLPARGAAAKKRKAEEAEAAAAKQPRADAAAQKRAKKAAPAAAAAANGTAAGVGDDEDELELYQPSDDSEDEEEEAPRRSFGGRAAAAPRQGDDDEDDDEDSEDEGRGWPAPGGGGRRGGRGGGGGRGRGSSPGGRGRGGGRGGGGERGHRGGGGSRGRGGGRGGSGRGGERGGGRRGGRR